MTTVAVLDFDTVEHTSGLRADWSRAVLLLPNREPSDPHPSYNTNDQASRFKTSEQLGRHVWQRVCLLHGESRRYRSTRASVPFIQRAVP